MMNNTISEYNPWLDAASYQREDAYRFKGREEDVSKYLRIVENGTMSVLYADSGIGKTSFINAGIIPSMSDWDYIPIHIIFPDDILKGGNIKLWLYDRLFNLDRENVGRLTASQYIWNFSTKEKIDGCEFSIWWLLHTAKITESGKTFYPLIIFDQFEELFVKAKNNNSLLNDFFDLVQELADESMPDSIEQELNKIASKKGTFVNFENIHKYKIVFSLRKEYLSEFDYWTNDRFVVPELFRNRMYLLPLTRKQAERVITEQTNPYENNCKIETLSLIKDDILNQIDNEENNEIEPIMLSILCSRLYQ